ncbi:Smr/MutS family protein [Amaricoccus solimangrovi]|uniref:DNA mismatch repair protein MutS n=1 Tax=Amaricoccus solimangrovi TaxID=2589815 RepID=A0A501WUX9_9RHOB|nr:Smr/MutS family protein [Amaricoccus solimangrovi]TPE52542.1 DNA mismatch repair protein MutS [Amaricoccus solimangrovi]
MGRGRRDLTEGERALWQQVADSARPLRSGTSLPALESAEATPLPDPVAPRAAALPAVRMPAGRRVARPQPPSATFDLAPDPHAALDRAHPDMDRRRFESLRRGRLAPEARLDLHGMTAERAHGALMSFILGAQAGGLRLVLVITGKGRPPEESGFLERRGILRHNVPHWLNAPPLGPCVLQVAPAHRKHGGGGAYYVYLRRRR